MGKHRILRIASRKDRVVTFREIWPSEDSISAEDATILDAGGTLIRDGQTTVDLNAYYEVSEAERWRRAGDLVF